MKSYSFLFFASIVLITNCTGTKNENRSPNINNSSDSSQSVVDNTNTWTTESNPEKNDECCVCNTTAYLNDPDTSGTNVRDVPGGKVIKKLKYDSDCACLMVEIVDSKEGWLQLKDGGWVFASLFSVDSRNYDDSDLPLYEEATMDSKIVHKLKGQQSLSVLGCKKDWLYVKNKQGKKGWLTPDMQCPNPLTTCP